MPNKLSQETSPYLLQHKDNPVDWYPWGDEALAQARADDKPIFLSIGYSACHWCHVMAHESFEDDETARYLNEHFVNIKVDREERPDVDSIYMNAVQAISGGGGWPMSMFLLPSGRPFYGGTYYPKNPRYGMPSFMQVLQRVNVVYHEQRELLDKDASNLVSAICRTIALKAAASDLDVDNLFEIAFQNLANSYDEVDGGFGRAPKFPPAMTLELLLRMSVRGKWPQAAKMVTHTLDRMMCGGMYDQIGGGFHRYSTDSKWLVPHFEKMLYDNALLIRAYLYGYQVTGYERYRRVVEESIEYLQREMLGTDDAFFSSQDADSEGHEGKFFVWTPAEVHSCLSDTANLEAVLEYWGLSQGSNFEGENILWVPRDPTDIAKKFCISLASLAKSVSTARKLLFEQRSTRIAPGTDTKILVAWNAMVITSLAQASRSLDNHDYRKLAVGAADFIIKHMYRDGRLMRTYKDCQARFNAYLEDYALFIESLIELYQSDFDIKWFRYALDLTSTMLELFWSDNAGFYDTASNHEALILRPQELTDNAIPSGNSAAIGVLLKMSILADRPDWRLKADRVLSQLAPAIQDHPSAFSYLACQLDFASSEPKEIVLIGPQDSEELHAMLVAINKGFHPNQLVAASFELNDSYFDLVLLRNREMVGGNPTAYVCRNYVCKLPVNTAIDLERQLAQAEPTT